MTGVVKRSPGIADLATVTARAVTRAVARPMDYQGGERLRMTTGRHDGKSCGPAGPVAMHSNAVQKYLRFPLNSARRESWCTHRQAIQPAATKRKNENPESSPRPCHPLRRCWNGYYYHSVPALGIFRRSRLRDAFGGGRRSLITETRNQKPHEKMKLTLSTYAVADLLIADNNANWSRAGARALAEYLEEIEESTGEEIEFDVVAIRCDFSEYQSLAKWADEYGFNIDEDEDEEAAEESIREYIQDRGQLVEFTGGIIVSSF